MMHGQKNIKLCWGSRFFETRLHIYRTIRRYTKKNVL